MFEQVGAECSRSNGCVYIPVVWPSILCAYEHSMAICEVQAYVRAGAQTRRVGNTIRTHFHNM